MAGFKVTTEVMLNLDWRIQGEDGLVEDEKERPARAANTSQLRYSHTDAPSGLGPLAKAMGGLSPGGVGIPLTIEPCV